jgi:hypothetical protein
MSVELNTSLLESSTASDIVSFELLDTIFQHYQISTMFEEFLAQLHDLAFDFMAEPIERSGEVVAHSTSPESLPIKRHSRAQKQ